MSVARIENGNFYSTPIDGYAKVYIKDNDITVNDNIFINSDFSSQYTVTAWDTTKNGNYCASNWGGYNGGVSNPSMVYHAHIETKDSLPVYNYTRNSDNNWLGVKQNLKGKLTLGTTYVFSADFMRISGTNYITGGIYTKASSSATSNSFVAWYEGSELKTAPVSEWIRCYCVMTLPSTAYITDGVSFYIYGQSGGSGVFLMRHPKLEVGTINSIWIPNSSDTNYTKYGFSSVPTTLTSPVEAVDFIEK